MGINFIQPEMEELIAPGATFERLADGFTFLEGPVWHEDGYLLFADVGADAIWRWDAREGATVWRKPSNIANGMSRDPQGRLVSCEQATSRLTRYEPDGTVTVLASHYQGNELNSPNDVVCRSDGCLYFSDPPAGRSEPHGRARETPRELDFQGVFLLRPGSEQPELQDRDMELPNGLCFSPDESLLYVNDTVRMQIKVFDVGPDGTLTEGRVFFQEPGDLPDLEQVMVELLESETVSVRLPDGMRADERGNIYCGGPGGYLVIDPDGRHIGTIDTPAFAANLSWGDDDYRSLYFCMSSALYRLPMRVAGAPPAFPR